MNRNVILRTLLINAIVLSGVSFAAEVPSKKSEPVDAPPSAAAASVPKAGSIEEKAKNSDRLKWDQLDPKAVERSTKKAQPKNPFSAVPPER